MKISSQRSRQLLPGALILLTTLATLLSGCAQRVTPQPSEPLPTLDSATPTVFFPTLIPTSTSTPAPTSSPAPGLTSGLGEVIFQDDFSGELEWSATDLAPGGVSVSAGRIKLSVRSANSLFLAISPMSPFSNGYVEIEARSELCTENDEFGLVFRINERFDHYRFMLTCEGKARVVGVVDGIERVLAPDTPSTAIIPGLLISNRLAVWIEGDVFRFFINGEQVFSERDLSLSSGSVGLGVRARQSGQTTASFDNFIIRSLLATPVSSPPG